MREVAIRIISPPLVEGGSSFRALRGRGETNERKYGINE